MAGRMPLGETFRFDGELGEQAVARYPGGEVVTVPRHVQTEAIRQRITTSTFSPHPRLGGTVGPATIALGALLQTPLRGPLDSLIDRLPEGPAEDARRASRFTIVAEAHARDGTVRRGTVHGSDVYGLTAVMGVELVRRLAEGEIGARGVLAPAQAVDPEEFLGLLGEHGIGYEVGSAPQRQSAGA
jgi:short subunit dehydrogenase-like uncharacterized protein